MAGVTVMVAEDWPSGIVTLPAPAGPGPCHPDVVEVERGIAGPRIWFVLGLLYPVTAAEVQAAEPGDVTAAVAVPSAKSSAIVTWYQTPFWTRRG